ncbi:hypothetical protein G9A89_002833 [Geosiphon pyriformis]|nr:hypothetical protein G9A89_002833 [Geosiphon pyriformis]
MTSVNPNPNYAGFLTFSFCSGTFAALASVFAKLLTDPKTVLLGEYLCKIFDEVSLVFVGCKVNPVVKNLGKEEETKQNGGGNELTIMYVIRICCFASVFICNALMWTLFTKALNRSTSSIQVTVFNSATNFCMTAIFGSLLFGETLNLQWWLGASLIISGTVLVNYGTGGGSNERVSDSDLGRDFKEKSQ